MTPWRASASRSFGWTASGTGSYSPADGGLIVDGADHRVGLQPELLETRQRHVEAGGAGEAKFGRLGEA